MSELRVFQFDGEINETVVALSIEDAWAVIKENTGCDREEYGEGEFVELDTAARFKLACDDEPVSHGFPTNDGWSKDDHGIWHTERSCAEWVTLAGRGHLGSSEW